MFKLNMASSCANAASSDDYNKLKSSKKCLACGKMNAVAKKRCDCGNEFISKWKTILKETPVVLTPERLRSKISNDEYESKLSIYSDNEETEEGGIKVVKEDKPDISLTDLQNDICVEVKNTSEKLYPKRKRVRSTKYDMSFELYDRNLMTAQIRSVNSYNEKLLTYKTNDSVKAKTDFENQPSKEELVKVVISANNELLETTLQHKRIEEICLSQPEKFTFQEKNASSAAPKSDSYVTIKSDCSFASNNDRISPQYNLYEKDLVTSKDEIFTSQVESHVDVSLTNNEEFNHLAKRPVGRPRKHLKLNMPKRPVGRPRKEGEISDKISYYQRKKAERLRLKLETENFNEHPVKENSDELKPKLTLTLTKVTKSTERVVGPNQMQENSSVAKNKAVKKRGRPKGSRDSKPRQIRHDYMEKISSEMGNKQNCGSMSLANPKKARCLLSPPSLMSSAMKERLKKDRLNFKENDRVERKLEKEQNYIPEEKKELFSLILDEINRKIVSQRFAL